MKHLRSSSRVLVVLAVLIYLGIARVAAADTLTLMWDANPEPEVAGYIVHIGTQPGTYTQHLDVGATTAYTFSSAAAGQQYCFAASAYFAGPVEGPKSTEVCGFSNRAPTLVNPGARSSSASQSTTLQLQGSDPDGLPVSYSATGLPPGLSLQSSTGFISGTPTTAGSFSVTASVSDGVLTASQTFTWTIVASDTAVPVVTITGPTSATTHTTTTATVTLSGTASDNVGVTQVTWVNGRGGSGTATGTTSWSAAGVALQVGSNAIAVTARDAAGNTATDVLTVTYDAAPTLAAVANQSSGVGQTVSLQLVGSDPNGTAVAFSATGLPAGVAVAPSTGLISGTTTVAGTYSVTATVSDGSLTASRAFTWMVTTADVIVPSVSITVPTSATSYTTTSSTLALAGAASDNVGVTAVTWSNDRGGSGVATGAMSWTATVALQSGTNVIAVTARDAAGNVATDVITVIYTVNRAPTLSSVPNQMTRVGRWDTLRLVGADADGDTLAYGANGLPAGLSINTATGRISGTPTTVGVYQVTVVVSDGQLATTRSFTWTIKKR